MKKLKDSVVCFILYIINGVEMFIEDIKKALQE